MGLSHATPAAQDRIGQSLKAGNVPHDLGQPLRP